MTFLELSSRSPLDRLAKTRQRLHTHGRLRQPGQHKGSAGQAVGDTFGLAALASQACKRGSVVPVTVTLLLMTQAQGSILARRRSS